MNTRRVLPALAAGFLALLLYLTVTSTPSPPPSGARHSAAGAERECTERVRERVPGARFPFAARAVYLEGARYRLHGYVDATRSGEPVRRNFECVVRYTEGAGYRADSVRLWQSH